MSVTKVGGLRALRGAFSANLSRVSRTVSQQPVPHAQHRDGFDASMYMLHNMMVSRGSLLLIE